jgi:3-oxoacyl-[acyl-carrier protein] reductase
MSARPDEHPGMTKGRGRLRDKIAVVTGADSGIGRATARLFAREGARVVCADIQESGSPRIDKLIERDGGEALFVRADVTKRGDCERVVAAAVDAFGDLDILFNNAGTGIPGRIDRISEEDWDLVLDTNLTSVFHGVRAALPHFERRGRGNIINTASTFGLLAAEGFPAYCASKGGVVLLTKQLALDLAPAIRVNCICPGATETALVRRTIAGARDPERMREKITSRNRCFNRLARPEEIAYGALFLASDESSFVTGHALVIDGGQTIDA